MPSAMIFDWEQSTVDAARELANTSTFSDEILLNWVNKHMPDGAEHRMLDFAPSYAIGAAAGIMQTLLRIIDRNPDRAE